MIIRVIYFLKYLYIVTKKINKPGVNFAGADTDSPKNDGLLSHTLIPGLVLLLGANGAHLRLFAGIWDIDSQSKFLLRVAHAIFFLRLTNDPYLMKLFVIGESVMK